MVFVYLILLEDWLTEPGWLTATRKKMVEYLWGTERVCIRNTVLPQHIMTESLYFSDANSHFVFFIMTCWSLFKYTLGSVRNKPVLEKSVSGSMWPCVILLHSVKLKSNIFRIKRNYEYIFSKEPDLTDFTCTDWWTGEHSALLFTGTWRAVCMLPASSRLFRHQMTQPAHCCHGECSYLWYFFQLKWDDTGALSNSCEIYISWTNR